MPTSQARKTGAGRTARKRVRPAHLLDRWKSSQVLETIFSSTEVLIACLDRDFNFLRVNRAYAQAEDRDPAFFPGKNHFDLYPDEENEAIFRQVVETGETYRAHARPFEYAEHPERGVTYWDWSLQPVFAADGSVTELVLTLVDVTERERAYLALRESEQLKEDFVCMVSHELRTPLAAIMGYTALLDRIDPAEAPARFKQATHRIDARAREMNRLVDNLLEARRIMTGEFSLNRGETDVAELVGHCVSKAGAGARHTIEVMLPERLPKPQCDRNRLDSALCNLLENAVKFSPQGGTIWVVVTSPRGKVRIGVKDQGVGLEPESIERIFEPFSQVDTSATRPFGGFGLGLYVTRKIVDAHGGRILVSSTPGMGSEFAIELPLGTRPARKSPPPRPSQ